MCAKRPKKSEEEPAPPAPSAPRWDGTPPEGDLPPEIPDPEGLPLPPEVDPWLLEVSDLKQYAYCPRVVYYRYRFPDFRPQTYKMEAGRSAHQSLRRRWRRRPPRRLPQGEARWEVTLVDPDLGLSGRVDLLLTTDAGLVVVDFKNARRVQAGWKIQLAAYGLLAERRFGRPVTAGYIYLLPLQRAERVPLTARRKAEVPALVSRIVAEIRAERQPPPTPRRARCVDCEYRRFCNDLF